MNLPEIIRNRRTIRKYTDKPVSREIVEKLIEAARWAPSAHNLQPWKFVVLDDKDIITKLSARLKDQASTLFTGFNVVLKDSADKIGDAPSVICVFSTRELEKRFERFGEEYAEIGKIFEVQSVACSIQNMLLLASNMSLGIAWHGITIFSGKEIESFLQQDGRLLAILTIGYPDEICEGKKIKSKESIVNFYSKSKKDNSV